MFPHYLINGTIFEKKNPTKNVFFYNFCLKHFSLQEEMKEIRSRVHIGFRVSKKVKCTLVQALRLCTGRTVHRGSRGIALLFLDHGTGWG